MSKEFSTSMYIGDTSRGKPQPVFFDSHTPLYNNRPPVTLITGSPGSGKTFWAMTLAAMSAILGKRTVILDPKGDFLSLGLIENDIGKVDFWDLARERKGILDPFTMTDDPSDQFELCLNIIDMFLGGNTPDEVSILSPIIRDVCDLDAPCMSAILRDLKASDEKIARNIGTRMENIATTKFGRLFFGNGKGLKLNVSEGVTVITLVGLNLKQTDRKGDEKTSNDERISEAIFYLITYFILKIMNTESKRPKSLIIDEAWAVASSQVGADVIKQIALLGRSKNLALTLVTQNTSHLKRIDIENTITSHFAFQTNIAEAKQIVSDMRLPVDGESGATLTTLETGECLMKDYRNRYAVVKISSYKENWKEAFRTNPLEKARAQKEREEAKRKALALGNM